MKSRIFFPRLLFLLFLASAPVFAQSSDGSALFLSLTTTLSSASLVSTALAATLIFAPSRPAKLSPSSMKRALAPLPTFGSRSPTKNPIT